MFRLAASRFSGVVSSTVRRSLPQSGIAATTIRQKHGSAESAEEFDARYEAFFARQDIDSWEVRKAMNDLQGMDLVPEPRIVSAAMKACRRLNDYALAVRYLEAVKDKCGPKQGEIWPYIVKEITPTIQELGISLPEEMGFDKPELALQDVYDMH